MAGRVHFHDTSQESTLSRDMGTVEVQEKCAAKEKAWEQRQQTRADETQAERVVVSDTLRLSDTISRVGIKSLISGG